MPTHGLMRVLAARLDEMAHSGRAFGATGRGTEEYTNALPAETKMAILPRVAGNNRPHHQRR